MASTETAPTVGPAGGASALPSAACAHCGLPVPTGRARVSGERAFCCEGCRTVHALLHEYGLERYYALRAAGAAAPAPVRPRDRTHAELDDPSVRARIGGPLPGGLESAELYLEGVHCAACVWLVERLPRLVPGVVEARLDLGRSRATVVWDPALAALSGIARALDTLGYAPHPARGRLEQDARRREERAMLARIGLAGAVAANVMAIAFALYGGLLHGMEPEFAAFFRWLSLGLTVPSFVWGGGVFFAGAWSALRRGLLHMDVPISVGLGAGFVHGALATVRGTGDVYFETITTLIFLLLSGRYLLRRQHRAAADATELLASLTPSAARRLEAGGVREVPLDALVPGDRVEVRAGEVVPADGWVCLGRSALDLALLSGESRPVVVAPGDPVHAGTVNVSARLEVTVERTGDETRVGRLVRLVDEQARRRAPIALVADRLSGVFVAVVLALAAVTVSLWWTTDRERAVAHAVALLIVTCPCALALATPLAVSAAIGRAARAGILVKGADVMERLARPGRMWLDKTGTLTTGRPALVSWWGDPAARPLVAAVEAHSAHPVARALVTALGPDLGAATTVTEEMGGGVEGHVAGRRVLVGSPRFVADRGARVAPVVVGEITRLVEGGITAVVVAVDGEAVAVAGLGDELRPDATSAVARIRAHGWRVGILSGDDPRVVTAVGRSLGLEAALCRGMMSPEDKVHVIRSGAAQGAVVMVGDGVNDAAALAAATVGVGVHGGAEAVLAAADVYVARPGVAAVAELLDGAERTLRVIRRNLALSLGYNAVAVTLAMGGHLDPVVAAILMPLSSVTVIASSFRARTFREPTAAHRADGSPRSARWR
ncbi:MAG TPA: heavy metal translocating P-type ATPase [Methylomirabilota bacterium]|nr:heavy metal translocating P-type ATPase [Methylomirabilota bacterium]